MHCAPIAGLADGSGRPADMCTYYNPDAWYQPFDYRAARYLHARHAATSGVPVCTGALEWRPCA